MKRWIWLGWILTVLGLLPQVVAAESSTGSLSLTPGLQDREWGIRQVIRHPAVRCVTFLARTPDDDLLVATYNNTNTTDVVHLWFFPRNREGFGQPLSITSETIRGYHGFGGLDCGADGSIVATVDHGRNGDSKILKFRPDLTPDLEFGDQGVIRLPGARAQGVTIMGDRLHVGLSWGRIRTYDWRRGTLLAESRSLIPAENGNTMSSTAPSATGATTQSVTEQRQRTPIVPHWMIPPQLRASKVALIGSPIVEPEPRLRDLASDPRTGKIYAVGNDRLWVFHTQGNEVPGVVGPELLIDGKGPVLPGQGVSVDPQDGCVRYAVNDVGTLAEVRWTGGLDGPYQLGLFNVFQAQSTSSRAVDSIQSADGETLWVSDLSGAITEYRRRSQPTLSAVTTADTMTSMAVWGLDRLLQPNPAESPTPGSVSEPLPAAEVLRTARGGVGQILILFHAGHREGSQNMVRQYSELTARLPSFVRPTLCDVAVHRDLMMKYSIYTVPTLLVTDAAGQEIARLEGTVDRAALVDVLVRARKAPSPPATPRPQTRDSDPQGNQFGP